MSLFGHNWVQIAQQHPELYGWLLASDVDPSYKSPFTLTRIQRDIRRTPITEDELNNDAPEDYRALAGGDDNSTDQKTDDTTQPPPLPEQKTDDPPPEAQLGGGGDVDDVKEEQKLDIETTPSGVDNAVDNETDDDDDDGDEDQDGDVYPVDENLLSDHQKQLMKTLWDNYTFPKDDGQFMDTAQKSIGALTDALDDLNPQEDHHQELDKWMRDKIDEINFRYDSAVQSTSAFLDDKVVVIGDLADEAQKLENIDITDTEQVNSMIAKVKQISKELDDVDPKTYTKDQREVLDGLISMVKDIDTTMSELQSEQQQASTDVSPPTDDAPQTGRAGLLSAIRKAGGKRSKKKKKGKNAKKPPPPPKIKKKAKKITLADQINAIGKRKDRGLYGAMTNPKKDELIEDLDISIPFLKKTKHSHILTKKTTGFDPIIERRDTPPPQEKRSLGDHLAHHLAQRAQFTQTPRNSRSPSPTPSGSWTP